MGMISIYRVVNIFDRAFMRRIYTDQRCDRSIYYWMDFREVADFFGNHSQYRNLIISCRRMVWRDSPSPRQSHVWFDLQPSYALWSSAGSHTAMNFLNLITANITPKYLYFTSVDRVNDEWEYPKITEFPAFRTLRFQLWSSQRALGVSAPLWRDNCKLDLGSQRTSMITEKCDN